MLDVLKGIRILEVAEHTFVPAASAVLAEWGADVIKVEHAERGDAMRGLAQTGVVPFATKVHVLMEHSNRGKRSIGIDISKPEGLELVYRLAATADVFLTNKTPPCCASSRSTWPTSASTTPRSSTRAEPPSARAGPTATRAATTSRLLVPLGQRRELHAAGPARPGQPAGPGYGDSIGAMTIAGGIAGALLKRERTGEPSIVDVSLLGTGVWALGQAIGISLQSGEPLLSPRSAATLPPRTRSWAPIGRGRQLRRTRDAAGVRLLARLLQPHRSQRARADRASTPSRISRRMRSRRSRSSAK